ncbi:hypothetical protein T8K17_18000 [Thalassobaculum sp. OXR-137]|uniref:hypothetical protein n=1 Tax=Thalassobaculum sp. OXR-137 TaxID=3100173 RepID=UPI002AC933D2|nr:hypothetical protein [Thalassobaculum sp. OXR-137]WPZ33124.1 hypothetical protein T8K17_18000 [Thalassobaculum sp. OXR-137]
MTRPRTDNPKPATLRTRKWRALQKAGKGTFFYRQEADDRIVGLLIDHGIIEANVSEDHKVLSDTVYRLVFETLTTKRNAFDTSRSD